MARVTVEDCIKRIKNRFDLVITAADRTRQIAQGAEITVDRDNDKNTVISLREIASDTLNLDSLKDSLVKKYQRVAEAGSEEDIEVADLMKEEQQWVTQPEDPNMTILQEETVSPPQKDQTEVGADLIAEAFENVSEEIAD